MRAARRAFFININKLSVENQTVEPRPPLNKHRLGGGCGINISRPLRPLLGLNASRRESPTIHLCIYLFIHSFIELLTQPD